MKLYYDTGDLHKAYLQIGIIMVLVIKHLGLNQDCCIKFV